jgi:DNA-binding transcriptional MocR family regulator
LEKNHLVQFRMRRKAGPTPLFEVQLNLAAKGSRESARTLYRELRDAIVEGRLFAGARHSHPVDFRPALVDPRLFPFDVFRRVSARQLRGLERRPASYKSPQGNQGHFYLCQAIARHIAITRAVVRQPEDVLVTSGAQQAFDLLARTLVTRGETVVAIEDPGYPPLRIAFAVAGAKIVPIGVDDEGLIVEQHLKRAPGSSLATVQRTCPN